MLLTQLADIAPDRGLELEVFHRRSDRGRGRCPICYEGAGFRSQLSCLAHLPGADVRIRRLQQVVLQRIGTAGSRSRGCVGPPAAVDDEIGDQPPTAGDLETMATEAGGDEEAVEPDLRRSPDSSRA